jgi:hypothetical protein
MISRPAADVVRGALAGRTTRIRPRVSGHGAELGRRRSGVSVLFDARRDPRRPAEVILGRGASVDSFPLFGYNLAD